MFYGNSAGLLFFWGSLFPDEPLKGLKRRRRREALTAGDPAGGTMVLARGQLILDCLFPGAAPSVLKLNHLRGGCQGRRRKLLF